MPKYDASQFDPPAPLALVTVHSPRSGASIHRVPVLLDSGADVSLLPRLPIASVIDPKDERGQYALEGFDGTQSLATAVRLEVRFIGKVFRGNFLLTTQDYGILGRNVLNRCSLLLDGPNLTWDEYQEGDGAGRELP